jgi:hypothetical protein
MNRHEPPLEQRIVAALGNPNNGSEALVELIHEVEQAAAVADQTAADERAKAVDLMQKPDPRAAHERVVDAEIRRDRLRGAMPKLRDKLADAIASEARERWSADYRRVRQKLDEAVKMFGDYRQHAEAIAQVFALAEQVDKEISRINGTAPDGEHRRLRSVELEARNLERFTRDNPSLVSTVELRDWENSGRKLWPVTSSGSLAAAYAETTSAPYHPGQHWADPEVVARRRQEADREQRRQAEFNIEQTATQECAWNEVERERFAQAHKRR